MRAHVDLSVLDYCREDCGIEGLHRAHGPHAGVVTVSTSEVFVGPVTTYRCDVCGMETSSTRRARPYRCGYCHAGSSKLRATGCAPGMAACPAGLIDAANVKPSRQRGRYRATCPTCRREVEASFTPDGVPFLREHRAGVVSGRPGVYGEIPVDPVLADVTLGFVHYHVPRSIQDIHDDVLSNYGDVSLRSTQRAVAQLTSARLVASISEAPRAYTSPSTSSGWYIRYDSPKLWSRDGLRDLIDLVADSNEDRGRRATADNQASTEA